MGDLTWRKSSYSDGGGDSDDDASNCVELALGAVRDSKNGSVLSVDVTALVAAVKAGQIS